MTFYAVYNLADNEYVVDTNQYAPRPPRLYSSVEAAQRRIAEERKHWKSRHEAYLKVRARNETIYSWLEPRPWNDNHFEVREMILTYEDGSIWDSD